jgi:formylglycine-generating enzyme required for sulfatase activity
MQKITLIATLILLLAGGAFAQLIIETVTVGNPGNPDDIHFTGFGGVDYTYNIGKYMVTAGQYKEFLNAVAGDDTYELYHTMMPAISDTPELSGCGIFRSGSPGSYTYSVAGDWADRPVNWVNWGDAARFCNWLHNEQPTGTQNLTTTEDGSYYLDGAITNPELMAITREPDATWVIPTEDEFYKAAFHKNDGVTGNYWNYATGTDDHPSYELIDPDPGNNATFMNVSPEDWTIGAPYWRTEVGAHENSASPYGTFDQGGNLWEWTEGVYGECRATGYGSFDTRRGALSAEVYNPSCTYCHATDDNYETGIRVAEVSGPSAVDDDIITPQSTTLNGNYPNPFNAATNISFDLAHESNVNLSVYNLMGQEVEVLINDNLQAGNHNINWDASNYSSGIYFYKLTTGEKVLTKEMVLIK